MDAADIKAKVAEDMLSLLPEDMCRVKLTALAPPEADLRERRLSFTVEMPVFDQALVRGLAESLIRKRLGMQGN